MRLPPVEPSAYEPIFGVDAPLRNRVLANSASTAVAYRDFLRQMRVATTLPPRLIELVRLRVAFHNQCRSCISLRYGSFDAAFVTEDEVCSLERPQEAEDFSEAEKAALDYADRMATNHLSVTDETFARLREHFSDAEVVELCVNVASFVGFGRMLATLAITEDLPIAYSQSNETVAPWRTQPAQRIIS